MPIICYQEILSAKLKLELACCFGVHGVYIVCTPYEACFVEHTLTSSPDTREVKLPPD